MFCGTNLFLTVNHNVWIPRLEQNPFAMTQNIQSALILGSTAMLLTMRVFNLGFRFTTMESGGARWRSG